MSKRRGRFALKDGVFSVPAGTGLKTLNFCVSEELTPLGWFWAGRGPSSEVGAGVLVPGAERGAQRRRAIAGPPLRPSYVVASGR